MENLVDLIGQLDDFAEPPPVSLFPATWPWAALAALLMALLATGLRAFLRHRRATAYRRAALAELRTLAPAIAAARPDARARLQALLRRTALAAFPRPEVATLTGAAWAAFLDETGGRFGPLGPALAEAPYRPVALDGPAALAAARHWIRHPHA